MKLSVILTITALSGGSTLACGDEDEGNGAHGGTLGAVTYNAGLAVGFVDYADARAPKVAEALAGISQDVLCVQEVWLQEHWAALVAAAKTKLPFSQRLEPDPGEVTNSCMTGELDPLAACVEAHCASVSTDMLTGCVTENCGDALGAISSTCLDCLIANVGTGDLQAIRTACEMGGGSFAYGGSFGTGILSRYELLDQDALKFDSTANRRAVLYSRIAGTPVGEVHVFCTHLTPIFDESEIPYTGSFGSWQGEQAEQITELLSYIDAKAGNGRVLLLGDLNTGPAAAPGIDAEAPENYQAVVSGNLTDVYVEQGDVKCTFCTDNPLVAADERSVLIDHVLVRDLRAVDVEQILRDPVDIAVDGQTITTRYSDHYGLRADLEAAESR